MNIAYIIQTYLDPEHLKRLVRSLDNDADFFIHIDAKVNIKPFERDLTGKNIFFVKKRVWASWGGFSSILIQKELLRMVVSKGKKYDRVVFLSGLDYPLWSNAEIEKEFAANSEKQYLMAMNVSQSKLDVLLSKVKYRWYMDIKIKNHYLMVGFRRLFSSLSRLLPDRKSFISIEGKKLDVYFGSDWFSLTYECAKYVSDKMNTEFRLINFFKHTFAPSELCVHTIVFNSPYASSATICPNLKYNGLQSLTPLHYIDYKKQIKIFNENDYKILRDSGKMFVRKVVTGYSDKLMDMIDSDR